MAGEKRASGELGEKSEVARKKIKMRNLESVLRFEGKILLICNFFCCC